MAPAGTDSKTPFWVWTEAASDRFSDKFQGARIGTKGGGRHPQGAPHPLPSTPASTRAMQGAVGIGVDGGWRDGLFLAGALETSRQVNYFLSF